MTASERVAEGFPDVLDPVRRPLAATERSLPSLRVAADGPPVRAPSDEPLVPVEGPGLAVIPVYAEAGLDGATPQVLARAGVVDRLRAAATALPPAIGLVVLDGWRSLRLQQVLRQRAIAAGLEAYVSEPSDDPQRPPPHLTGGTVDVTLSHRGRPLALGSAFDEFTDTSHVAALEGTDHPARDLRRLLSSVLDDQGFVVHPLEWWHHEYGTRGWAGARGRTPRYGAITEP